MGSIRQPRPLEFGAKSYVDALKDRIRRHLRHADREPPFVAGLFGPWGSGKTLWLEHLRWEFERVARSQAKKQEPRSLNLPVFFNAWRYEHEDHLIVPLIFTSPFRPSFVPIQTA